MYLFGNSLFFWNATKTLSKSKLCYRSFFLKFVFIKSKKIWNIKKFKNCY